MSEQDKTPDSDRFDRFTVRARKVMTLAQEEATRFNHNYIGTEHLLLGLVRTGRRADLPATRAVAAPDMNSTAAKALDNLGVEMNRVRSAVEFIIARGDRGDRASSGEVGLTPGAKKVIELALDEARRLKHRYIGPEHLLLGMVREGEGIAARILMDLGVTLEQVRTEVVRILGGGVPGAKNNVVMCRLDDRALDALDTLIEAGVRATRSDAAAWLIQAGIEASEPLFESVAATVVEIRRLRAEAQHRAQQIAQRMSFPTTNEAVSETETEEGPQQTPPTDPAE